MPEPAIQIKGSCGRCPNRETCVEPCPFVESYLRTNNRTVFEKKKKGSLVILYPMSKHIRESEIVDEYSEKEGSFRNRQSEQAFSMENRFIDSGTITLKQTGIFIDRFFYRMSYADLALKYESTKSGIAKLYVNAKQRLLKTVKAMDRIELAKNNGTPLAELSLPANVKNAIKDVEARVKLGKVDFLCPSDEERETLKRKLEDRRKLRRNKYKEKNHKKRFFFYYLV